MFEAIALDNCSSRLLRYTLVLLLSVVYKFLFSTNAIIIRVFQLLLIAVYCSSVLIMFEAIALDNCSSITVYCNSLTVLSVV